MATALSSDGGRCRRSRGARAALGWHGVIGGLRRRAQHLDAATVSAPATRHLVGALVEHHFVIDDEIAATVKCWNWRVVRVEVTSKRVRLPHAVQR